MYNPIKTAGNWLAQQIAGYLQSAQLKEMLEVQRYYEGYHPPQLKTKMGQADDNVALNWLGLSIDRAVSMLMGGGVEFSFPEGEEDKAEYIDNVWNVNKRGILLHDTALDGALFGTPYLKIIHDGIADPFSGATYPRLVLLDPKLMRIVVDPRDKSRVMEYVMEYVYTKNGKEMNYKEVTRRANEQDFEDNQQRDTWIVEEFEFYNQWVKISAEEFPYEFPPIHHWKNLPSIHSVYGMSDIGQVINAQDKYNFVQSNNVKITRYHAHPKTWGSGFTKTDKTSWGADEMVTISSPDGKINNLEMQSDLSASRSIAADLRQAIFDLTRQVDISSVQDKVGQLTNFGLRLFYADSLAKVDTKQELYSEAFSEINRRLLIMRGWEGENSRPGEVVWGDSLPVNVADEMAIDKTAIDMGIVDKQTVFEKYADRYGLTWDDIQERLLAEKGQEQTLGSMLLRNFQRGQ